MFSEIIKDVLPIIHQAAPVIASALLSPGLAGKFALSLISQAFDIKPHEMDNLSKNILNDSDAHSKLAEIESKFSTWFKNNSNMRMPSKAELNLKMEWIDSSTANTCN